MALSQADSSRKQCNECVYVREPRLLHIVCYTLYLRRAWNVLKNVLEVCIASSMQNRSLTHTARLHVFLFNNTVFFTRLTAVMLA